MRFHQRERLNLTLLRAVDAFREAAIQKSIAVNHFRGR
jgi:hypothetical protein